MKKTNQDDSVPERRIITLNENEVNNFEMKNPLWRTSHTKYFTFQFPGHWDVEL